MHRYLSAARFLALGLLVILTLYGCTIAGVSARGQNEPQTASQQAGADAASTSAPTLLPSATHTAPPVATSTVRPTLTPTAALPPTRAASATASPTATPDTRPEPKQWRSWPVVPVVSARALEIYQRGLALGNNPRVFSRIGDCQSEPSVFLGIYDIPGRYTFAPDDAYLQETVDYYAGSFERTNITVHDGFGVASIFSPLMADPKQCESGETPLACEFRLAKPSVVFISMGTNWCAGCTNSFEDYLRKTVDYAIEQGVVPVLMTKADNIEGDNSINEAIAQVAYDYDLPLWNFWLAAYYLPDHGLKEDGVYLTYDAWDVRSFTGLRTLDNLRKQFQPLTP